MVKYVDKYGNDVAEGSEDAAYQVNTDDPTAEAFVQRLKDSVVQSPTGLEHPESAKEGNTSGENQDSDEQSAEDADGTGLTSDADAKASVASKSSTSGASKSGAAKGSASR